jgi:hypothetical protein
MKPRGKLRTGKVPRSNHATTSGFVILMQLIGNEMLLLKKFYLPPIIAGARDNELLLKQFSNRSSGS